MREGAPAQPQSQHTPNENKANGRRCLLIRPTSGSRWAGLVLGKGNRGMQGLPWLQRPPKPWVSHASPHPYTLQVGCVFPGTEPGRYPDNPLSAVPTQAGFKASVSLLASWHPWGPSSSRLVWALLRRCPPKCPCLIQLVPSQNGFASTSLRFFLSLENATPGPETYY